MNPSRVVFLVFGAILGCSGPAQPGRGEAGVVAPAAPATGGGSGQARSVGPGAAELARAVRDTMVTPEGGVVSYYRNDERQEDPDVAGVGHERLSESTGLLLVHATAARDPDLGRLAAEYYRTRLRSSVGLSYWKLDERDEPAAGPDGSYSSAPIDELRIATALAELGALTGDATYHDDARRLAKPLLVSLTNDVPADDVSWGPYPPRPSERIEVDYLDVAAMRRLGDTDPQWSTAATRSLEMLRGSRSGTDGPPRQFYDPARGEFSCDRGVCGTTAGIYTAMRLYDGGDTPSAQAVYRYYSGRLSRDGALAGAYSPGGAAREGEDLACYALLARLAVRLGDPGVGRSIVDRWIAPRRVTSGPLAGLYSSDAHDASSFVNLQILLTFHEMEGRRVPAD